MQYPWGFRNIQQIYAPFIFFKFHLTKIICGRFFLYFLLIILIHASRSLPVSAATFFISKAKREWLYLFPFLFIIHTIVKMWKSAAHKVYNKIRCHCEWCFCVAICVLRVCMRRRQRAWDKVNPKFKFIVANVFKGALDYRNIFKLKSDFSAFYEHLVPFTWHPLVILW